MLTSPRPLCCRRATPLCAGSVPTFGAAVAAVEKIRFYAGEVRSRSKMHVTVGHTTGGRSCLTSAEWEAVAGSLHRAAAGVVPACASSPSVSA